MNVETRTSLERRIAGKAIDCLLAAGYSVTVDDGEDYPLKQSTNKAEILKAMFSVDEEHLIAFDADGNRKGQLFFVYGNDGWDALADYTASLEAVLEPVSELADELCLKHG